MSDKPSYLGLLNAIALGETEAEAYLDAWADVTPSDEVRQVLRTVAIREGEHGKAFTKRICELGFEVKPREDTERLERRMKIASSTELSDAEKFDKLDVGPTPEGDDIFAGMFRDQSIDIQTGALLGRYIAEERDSNRMLRACRAAVSAASSASNGNGNGNGTAAGPQLSELASRLDRIEGMLEKSLKKYKK